MKRSRLLLLCAFSLGSALLLLPAYRSTIAQQGPKPGTVAGLPGDIYPDTFARAPLPRREDFKTDEEKKAFDTVAGPEGLKPGPIPPNNLRLYYPIASDHYRTAIRWLREQSGLEPKYAELSILVAVREWNGQYEWTAHEPSALKAGISQATIEVVRNKADTKGVPEKEEAIIRFGREMKSNVSPKTFADMERQFGRKGTLAIAMIMTHYVASATLLHAYDAHWDPAKKPPFPIQ
jgi:4-carboxymuconolactone decarboxylase